MSWTVLNRAFLSLMNVTVSELRGRALNMYLRTRTVFCWSTCASFVWCRIDGLQLVLGT